MNKPDRPTAPPLRPRPIPQTRLTRALGLGSTATGVLGGAAARGLGQLATGKRPVLGELLLTPGNIKRLTDELARMRGAAMKVGQLISMDPGDLLPPELAAIMARLRAGADPMPPRQLKLALNAAWGDGWLKGFKHFDVHPIAAASIGQVHRAQTRDGRDLAIKVQYPGVARSINSDVSNVGALLKLSGLAPEGVDLSPFLDEARRQLHEEADYLREAREMADFGRKLAGQADRFRVPEPVEDLVAPSVLAMEFLPGIALEDTADHPQPVRDGIARSLFELAFDELFQFGVMQTDPNFANYRYDPQRDQIVLLDFGAVRHFTPETVVAYTGLLSAALSGPQSGAHAALEPAAEAVGLFTRTTAPHHKHAVTELIEIASSAILTDAGFDFGTSTLPDQLRDKGMALGADRSFDHIPPMDTFYLQRKFAGLFLLARLLRARVDLRSIALRHLP